MADLRAQFRRAVDRLAAGGELAAGWSPEPAVDWIWARSHVASWQHLVVEHQVAPAELEGCCWPIPVADAAVIGRRGEVPVAVVVPRGKLDAGALMLWVAGRVAPYKRLREIRFADALPRSPAGKLLRRALLEQDRAACKADCAAPTLIAL